MYFQNTVLIQIIQNYKSVFLKDTFDVNFSNFLKMSFEKTLLKSVFLKDTLHTTKTILYLGIFLNLYYLNNFLLFFTLNV